MTFNLSNLADKELKYSRPEWIINIYQYIARFPQPYLTSIEFGKHENDEMTNKVISEISMITFPCIYGLKENFDT